MFASLTGIGRVVMDRLTYRQRFACIGLVFAPLLVIIGLLLKDLHDNTEFSETERRGAQLLLPFQDLLFVVQGTASAGRLDQGLAACEAAGADLGRVPGVQEAWIAWKNGFGDAHAQRPDTVGRDDGVDGLIRLIGKIADQFNLSLDPDMDSYYLMNGVVFEGSALLAALAQARDHVAAAGDPAAQSNAALEFLRITEEHAEGTLGSYRKAMAVNAELRSALAAPVADLEGSVGKAIHELLALTGKPQGQPGVAPTASSLAAASNEALDKLHSLSTSAIHHLDGLLTARIATIHHRMYATLTFTLFGLVLLVYICTVFYLSFRYSVQGLAWMSAEIASGNLSVKLNDSGRDELSAVARGFTSMRNQLKSLVSKLTGVATPLTTATEEMATVLQQTAKEIHQQQSETDQVATAANEMASTAAEIARNANSAAEAARGADALASSAWTVLVESMQLVKSLAQEVENAAEVVNGVKHESSQIGIVLDVIRGIAEQTNLLALNAAIEAARAGDQGRGFAVVADEVRTLASRTAQSTQEINGMIGRLQSSTSNAVKVMEESGRHAIAAVEHSNKTQEALQSITGSISSINDMNHQIASAAEEQSLVVETLNRNLVAIRDIGIHTADGATKISSATQELTRMAVTLQAEIARFRL